MPRAATSRPDPVRPSCGASARTATARAGWWTGRRNRHQDQPDWSPDGGQIVFTSWAGGAAGTHLESVPADGGPATVLTDPGIDRDLLPAWSPTGDRLAFVRQPDGEGPAQLWVAAADGSGARRVAELAAEAGSLAWTPDGGRSLVSGTGFGDDRRLRLVDVESGAVAVLDADGALATFVPGTDRLHYLAPDGAGDNPFRPAEGRLVDGQVVIDRFTGSAHRVPVPLRRAGRGGVARPAPGPDAAPPPRRAAATGSDGSGVDQLMPMAPGGMTPSLPAS